MSSFFTREAWEPLARAFTAFQRGEKEAVLRVHSDLGGPDLMPVAVFFRGRRELREVDRLALRQLRGRILDVGAGAGSMALLAQEDGFEVTAVEVIPEAVEIMRERGVRDARRVAVEDLPERGRFDTILLLMNGTAVAGTMGRFPLLLGTLRRLLAPDGQVLLDSTELRTDRGSLGGEAGPTELHYLLEFGGVRGAPFPQLFLAPGDLVRVCRQEGWEVEILGRWREGEYLARLR